MKQLITLLVLAVLVGCAGSLPTINPEVRIKAPPSNPPRIWLAATCGFEPSNPTEAICITEDAAGNQLAWPTCLLEMPQPAPKKEPKP